MSIGQRIAQKRKELGLSQEALGELLGVSRQAIYKWESDGALPEVEKLIQLSKHFGVSVGWLLGVEEEQQKENAADHELNEQQLRMVEEIVSRYLAAQPKPTKRKRWVTLTVAAALLLVVWSLFSRLEQIDNRYQSLQNSVSHMSSQVNSEIGSISNRVEEALKQQALFTAEYSAEILEMDIKNARVRFSAYAVPKTFVEGMRAEFILESGEEVATLLVTDAPQQKFSGEMECTLTDDMRISVAFIHPDGTRDLQLLESFRGYLSDTYPNVNLQDYHLFGMDVVEGKVKLEDYYVILRDTDPGKGDIRVESIRVGLFRNQKLLAWGEPCEQPDTYRGYEEYDFYHIPDMEVEMGQEDLLQVAALVTDSLGREFMVSEVPYVVDTETTPDQPYLTYPPTYDDERDPAKWDFHID